MATARPACLHASAPIHTSDSAGTRRRRLLRPRGAAAVALIAGIASLLGPAAVTSAAPKLTIAQVQARIAALNTRAEKITEAYDAAHVRLADLQRQQRLTAQELRQATKQLDAKQAQIAEVARSAYRNAGMDNLALASGATSPQTLIEQSAVLDALSRAQDTQFADAAAAGHEVQVTKARYDAQATAMRKQLATIAGQKAHIQSLLAQSRHLLASLRAADRARLAAAQARTASHQVAMRSSYHGPATGQAAAAVRFAYAQLGKPYVYGAAGPSSYDCSGLTMAAWGAAGVSLPHNAAMQQSMSRYVSASQAQPGDLVFFGSPAYHVGIYIGGGRMIAAPHTGDVVKVEAVYAGVSGYGRP